VGDPGTEQPAPQAGIDAVQATRIEALVELARTALLFRLTPRPVVAGAAVSVLICLVLWPTTGRCVELLAWLASRLAISGLRIADCLDFTRLAAPAESLRARRARFAAMLAIDCITWSAAGLLFVGDVRPQLGLALLASLAVVAAVSLYSLASDFRVAALFFSVILVPNAAFLFWLGTPDAFVGAAAMLVLEALLLFEARGLELRLVEMLRLRHEVMLIAAERQRALLLAEHSSRTKSRFLATVSHEMRTPLNGILGMAQLLMAARLPADQAPRVDAIVRSARHLERVISDLLDQSGIESGRIAVVKVKMRLRDALREVIEIAEPLATTAGLLLEVRDAADLPDWIEGDPARIKQVVFNLVSNAIKFTRSGRILVSMERAAEHIVLRVEDPGIGIAPEQIDRLFRAFEPLAQPGDAEYRPGTGLGLTISLELAQAMGGNLTCSSTLGHGSTFDFTFPIGDATPPEVPDPAAHGESAPLSGCVLLVEDDPINALIARTILEREGLQVETVSDGKAALDCLARSRYAVVLMDCQLPILSGWLATARWRERERALGCPRVPIIALTANSVAGDRERCVEAGMDDYLAKPFELQALVDLVRRYAVA
jgi:signal transduction histidine kinase/CheY-like chemotaxis protein